MLKKFYYVLLFFVVVIFAMIFYTYVTYSNNSKNETKINEMQKTIDTLNIEIKEYEIQIKLMNEDLRWLEREVSYYNHKLDSCQEILDKKVFRKKP